MYMKVRFYLTAGGRSPVEEFIAAQPESIRLELLDAISLLSEGRVLGMPLGRNLSGRIPGLHELRLRDRGGQVRVFYFVNKQDAIYLIHAFRKKTQDIPRHEIDVVKKRLKEIR